MTSRDALTVIGAIALVRVAWVAIASRIAATRAHLATSTLVGSLYWRSDTILTREHPHAWMNLPPRGNAAIPFHPAAGAPGASTTRLPRGWVPPGPVIDVPEPASRTVPAAVAVLLVTLGFAASIYAAPPPSTAAADVADQPHASPPPAIEVHFSPNGGCTATVVALIAGARGSVRLAGYQFTSEPVARALVDAHGHGRDVQVLVDRSSARTRQVAELRAAGVPVLVDARHHIFHDKFVVVDGAIVETGSFNFTDSAEHSNAENCVTIRDAAIAKQFGANWLGHHDHSAGGGS